VLQRLTARKEWRFFAVLPKADPGLAAAWWTVLLLRGILPAAFAIAMGVLVGAVQHGHRLAGPLAFAGAIFVLLQVLSPIHQAVSANLGDRTAAWLYDRLTEACVRPPGIGHLEDPTLTSDLTVARDFDLGMTGPPLSISMDFIATGMVELTGGVASAVILARYAWWAPLLLGGAWLATHWLLRESAIWRDRNTTPITPTAWRWIRRRARSCGSSALPDGQLIGSWPGAHACTSCSTPPLVCANARFFGACCW
jgi:ATP-binding cassette subfamily B protein